MSTLHDEDMTTTASATPGGGDVDQGDSSETQVDPNAVDPAGSDPGGGGDSDQGDSSETQVDPAGSDPAGSDPS